MMIWHGAIITGVLIRGMSCIITTVFDNTTTKPPQAMSESFPMLLMGVNKFKKPRMERALLHGPLVKAL